jgi:hypothetical protein
MVTGSLFGEDSVNAPSELAVMRLPNNGLGVGSTARILLAIRNSVEQKLITITDGSEEFGVVAPIDASNGSLVSGTFSNAVVVSRDIINVDVSIVRSDSKILSIR